MFVDIDNPKAPLGVEVMLFPYKKGQKKITPEVCLEVLKSTNYQRGISDMLNLILELPVKEQAPFKDVVLSTFDNREQPNDVIVLGKKLAVSGGYEDELAVVDRKVHAGEWLASKAVVEKWTVSSEKILGDKTGNVWFLPQKIGMYCYDLSNINDLRFSDGVEVDLRYARNLPASLDMSVCSKVQFAYANLGSVEELKFGKGAEVNFWSASHLPFGLDVSKCARVNLGGCDLSSVNELKFAEGAEVDFHYACNLPEDLDVSMCSKVLLSECDLAKVKQLKFADGAEVSLCYVKNMPKNLDLSNCAKVNLGGCDLSLFNALKFADGAEVDFGNAINLPAGLDLSMCSQVDLAYCDLGPVNDLKFADGAKVNLYKAKHLPKVLDVSMCSEVNLEYGNLSRVEKILFKNKQQLEDSYLEVPEDWKGKLVFVERNDKTSKLNRFLGNLGNFLPYGVERGR